MVEPIDMTGKVRARRAVRVREKRRFCTSTALAVILALTPWIGAKAQGTSVDIAPVDVTAKKQKPAVKRPAKPARATPAVRPVTARPIIRSRATRVAAAPAQRAAQRAAPAPAAPVKTVPTGGPTGVKGFTATNAVVGTKTNTPLVKVPQSVTVVTRENLNERNVQSLNEAVNYVPGALANVYGFDPRQDQILIRGFTTLYDGVYRDGLRRAAAGIIIPHAEIYALDSLSILRGPASGLYGLGNPGGIVELTSKRPVFTQFQEVQFQVGNYDRYQGNFDIGGPVANTNNEWAYRLTGVFRDSHIPFIMGAKDDRITIAPAVTYAPTNATSITFLTEYQRTRLPGTVAFFNFPNFVVSNIRFGDPQFNRALQNEYRVGYAFQHKFSENLLIRQNFRQSGADVNYAYTQVDSIAANGLTANRSSGLFLDRLNQTSVDNQVEGHVRIGPTTHTLLAGLDYSHVDFNRRNGFGAVPPLNLVTQNYGRQPIVPPALTAAVQQQQDQFGQYLQEQGEWDRLTVTLTGRHDNVQSNTATQGTTAQPFVRQVDEAFSGRAGVNFRVADGVYPYASYATTFAPNLGTTLGGTPFQASRGDGKEVGVKTIVPHTNLHVNAAYFDLNQSNVLGQDPNNIGGQIATGKLNSRGFEGEIIDHIAPGIDFTASYTHLDVTIVRGLPTTTGKRFSGIPRDTFAAFGTYTPQTKDVIGGLTLGAGVRSFGQSFADDANTGINRAVTVIDALAAYDLGYLSPRFRGARLQVNAQNVFNRFYTTCIQSFCYRGAPAQVISSLIYRW